MRSIQMNPLCLWLAATVNKACLQRIPPVNIGIDTLYSSGTGLPGLRVFDVAKLWLLVLTCSVNKLYVGWC